MGIFAQRNKLKVNGKNTKASVASLKVKGYQLKLLGTYFHNGHSNTMVTVALTKCIALLMFWPNFAAIDSIGVIIRSKVRRGKMRTCLLVCAGSHLKFTKMTCGYIFYLYWISIQNASSV